MKINFKKISAIIGSGLMMGMSLGVAAAANYPAPFVSGGAANVAIVYGTGTGVSPTDAIPSSTSISTSLQSYMGAGSSGSTGVSTNGEVESLDTSQDRIWLNTSLTSVKSTITKTDLPTTLAEYGFSGDVTSTVTHTIKLVAGAAAGGENSGKVIFANQPESSDNPVLALSLGTGASSSPLYNASATMSAINFTHADSEGEDIELFGQSFTIASATDTTKLVLLKEAERIDLDSNNPTMSVTIEESEYTVELVSASDSAATIKVTNSAGASASKEINEAASKRVNGVDVAVITADETNQKLSASIIVGSKKVTLQSGSTVTTGEDDDPIDGTTVYIVGGTGATTEIAIAVFRPDSSTDAILPGTSFVDPVFGSFKLDFAGLSSPLDDTNREIVSVGVSGDDTMTVEFTEQDGFKKEFDFAHNSSATQFILADNSNYTIGVVESANLSYGNSGIDTKYTVVGNEEYGHLLELTYVNNNSGTDYNDDEVKFTDVMTRETYSRSTGEISFTSEGAGSLDVDGKRYTLTFRGSGEDATVRLKYPTSDSAASELVVFPTIGTPDGNQVALYAPTLVDFTEFDNIAGIGGTNVTKLWFPDGDGYTGFVTNYIGGVGAGNWTVNGVPIDTSLDSTTNNFTTLTVGELIYNVTGSDIINSTKIWLTDPEAGANIDQPGLIIYEGKDDKSEYHTVVVDLETNPGGTSDNGVGVNDVLFTQNGVSPEVNHASATGKGDKDDMTYDVDWFGTLTTLDATDSDQKIIAVSIPKNQVYAQLYLGAADSSASSTSTGATAGAQLGNILYKDSEIDSAKTKNLIVVGGSCINSVAATLVGGAKCTSDWQTATGVGSGQFLIQSFGDKFTTGKVALLVAGYEATDTVNAATYLTTKTVNTVAGTKYIGTSATSATLQTETTNSSA